MIRTLAFLALVTTAQAAPHYVRAGRLVDVEKGVVLSDQLITIEGDKITNVAPTPALLPKGDVTDWSGMTVIPGMIDLHTHLVGPGQSNNVAEPLLHSGADDVLIGARNARDTLRAGFTTVRDVGAWRAYTDVSLRNAINAGNVEGPRMAVAGAYVTIHGGGGEVTGLAPDIKVPDEMRAGVVFGVQSMRERVRALIQGGADHIKMIGTGAVLTVGTEPGQQELSEEEMRAGVEEAARMGKFVAVHAHGAGGIKAAIRAGARTIEHASYLDDEGIAMMKKAGTWLVADIYDGDYIEEVGTKEGWPEETLRKNRETTDVQRTAFTKAVKAGVNIGYGTDSGVYPHGLNGRQLKYMVRYGLTPMQTIQAATIRSATAMGWEGKVGAVTAGRFADMVAVKGDPLADISILENVAHVMKGGEIVK